MPSGGIASAKGVEWFTNLTYLNFQNNQLTELNVTNNTLLQKLYCQQNKLTTLDVSKNTSLTHLYCFQNLLAKLDVSDLANLIYLDCNWNFLTSKKLIVSGSGLSDGSSQIPGTTFTYSSQDGSSHGMPTRAFPASDVVW